MSTLMTSFVCGICQPIWTKAAEQSSLSTQGFRAVSFFCLKTMSAATVDFCRKVNKSKHQCCSLKVAENNVQRQHKVPIFGANPFNQPEDLLAAASAFLRIATRLGWDFDASAEQFESCLDDAVLHEWQTARNNVPDGTTVENALQQCIQHCVPEEDAFLKLQDCMKSAHIAKDIAEAVEDD